VFIVDRDTIRGFSVFSVFLSVSTSATDCLERLTSEMTCLEVDRISASVSVLVPNVDK